MSTSSDVAGSVPRVDTQHLHQRGPDGYPMGADKIMRHGWGPIPDAARFQHHRLYSYEMPLKVHGWQWSATFGRWSALVTFADGWTGYSWPEPQRVEAAAA